MPKQIKNDEERRLWVLNDEGLYSWWQGSRQPIRAFIRDNRAELDAAIARALAPPPAKTWRDYASNHGRD